MRSPGFEPGSSTWQADVLNQARLRPHEVVNTLAQKMIEEGLDKDTAQCYCYKLTKMSQEVNLFSPELVKTNIAKQKVCNATKNKYATAYNHLVEMLGLEWKKPYFRVAENIPLIPKPQDVANIIASC